ncbi:MAG: prenyltransferase [Chloroflexi bacterium]|nr:MAG: prenyltransferase [Chloroflexota bacterium]
MHTTTPKSNKKWLNFPMWRRALSVIPRLTAAEWAELDLISRWLIASRAAVLVITFIPAVIAGVLAWRNNQFNLTLWLLLTIGLVMAHATNNIVNDITDSWKGTDKGNYFRAQYGVQPIEHGLLTFRQAIIYALVTGLIALAAGLILVYWRGGLTLPLLGAGIFFVLFYTWPLKYIGLGEIAVIIVWGPLMIAGGYYVITGIWDWQIVLVSLPYALGATSVIFGKHIDKYQADKAKNIRTLPVILGERNARYLAIGIMLAQYLLVGYLILIRFFTPLLLLVLVAVRWLRLAWGVYRQPRPAAPPPEYPADAWPLWFVSFSFVHNRAFGTWFLVGLILDAVVQRLIL